MTYLLFAKFSYWEKACKSFEVLPENRKHWYDQQRKFSGCRLVGS